ncbi:Uridine kinase [Ceratocystis lukuohia]|uniref:uridine/cytidine kinase n=1 Tax=Ceratocystis lukuohia TaxID=2019550 RepID=A0ABR4MBJ5_9PEZI
MDDTQEDATIIKRTMYAPPWADVSIIGIAGSSGSGKSTLSQAIVKKLNLPWVVILPMDSFYKPLTPEQSKKAFRNEYDFDSPEAIDFEVIIQKLRDLKAGKRAEIPVYSFSKHQRLPETTTIYSPHVLVLEGIFSLYDSRVREILDMMYVDPQRKVADIIVPRGIDNKAAMTMMIQYIEKKLVEKSTHHRAALKELEMHADQYPLSPNVRILDQTQQLIAMNTIIQDIDTSPEDFIFYFDRLACLLIEQALNKVRFLEKNIETPDGGQYQGFQIKGEVSAVLVLRGGSAFETSMKRVMPDCKFGRMLVQSNMSTGEPELHYYKMPHDVAQHESVLLIDTQMASGGSALMAVQVLIDHGVDPKRIVFVAYSAGRMGLRRLSMVFPDIAIVVCSMVPDIEERWVEARYFRC